MKDRITILICANASGDQNYDQAYGYQLFWELKNPWVE